MGPLIEYIVFNISSVYIIKVFEEKSFLIVSPLYISYKYVLHNNMYVTHFMFASGTSKNILFMLSLFNILISERFHNFCKI